MRVQSRCPDCISSTRPGLIWLGGRDWLECPNCERGIITFDESRFTPKERIVSIPGLRPHVERKLFVPKYKGAADGLLAAREI